MDLMVKNTVKEYLAENEKNYQCFLLLMFL